MSKMRKEYDPNKVTRRKRCLLYTSNAWLHDDDFSIVQRFQQEYRGLVQY